MVKDRVGAEVKVNSDLVMICSTIITSTSNTLKTYISVKIIIHPIQLKNSIPKKSMNRLFSTYVTPQIKEIYHPAIIQEWKLNIDAA